MLPNHGHPGAGQPNGADSALASIGAFVTAFLGAPLFYSKTLDWVLGFTTRHYGYGWDETITYAWFGASAFLVFCLSRSILLNALQFGRVAVAKRLF